MKTSYKYLILIIAIGTLLITSCKKSFYTDVNSDPNAPGAVPPSTLLPTAEVGLAYTQGGNMSLFVSLIMQQDSGEANQAQFYYSYVFLPTDFDLLWEPMYTSSMENDYTLMQLADKNGYNEYSGIARILMAYNLQIMVDCWGKIPYSQALQGAVYLQPVYDNDQALYDTIGSLVSHGIALLNATNPGSLTPSSDDVIYGGVPSEWIAFANAISARLAIHQSKGNAVMAQQALTAAKAALGNGLSTASFANAEVYFGVNQTNGNPWFQFNSDREGYVSFAHGTLANELHTLHDPRYNVFADSAAEAGGGVGLGAYYGSSNSPVEFITGEELMFIEAEATVNSTGSVNAAATTAYDSAIAVNMEKLGIAHSTIVTYIAANQLSSTASTAIAQISLQEWIALYLNPEAWSVWRRNASPTLTPTPGNSQLPRRFTYPSTEINYNGANTAAAYPGQQVTLYSPKIFWDN